MLLNGCGGMVVIGLRKVFDHCRHDRLFNCEAQQDLEFYVIGALFIFEKANHIGRSVHLAHLIESDENWVVDVVVLVVVIGEVRTKGF